MKLRTFAVVSIAPLALMAGLAQPDKTQKPAGQPDKVIAPAGQPSEQEMMAAMMKAAEPGAEHARIAQLAGTWDGKVSSWMAPGQPADTSEGTMTNSMVLGRRQLKQEWKGDFDGMPFEGLGYFGYDNVKKEYHAIWTDTWSTGLMICHGTYDDATKTYTLRGSFPDPMTGKDMHVREVLKIQGADKHTMEMYGPGPDGKEYKMMELVYTRAGGAGDDDATR